MSNQNFETYDISYTEKMPINFLYNRLPGRALLNILTRISVSRFFGFLMDSPASSIFIRSFIKRNRINIEEYANREYKSFNEFFSRKIKKEQRPFPDNEYDAAAPCDGKLTAYQITADSVFQIKKTEYSAASLLQDKTLAEKFMEGVCLIFRLMPEDYHRYSYIDDGECISHKKIKGILHTVRPISQQRYRVYAQNAREYTVMQTKNFGQVVQLEVGALLVGRIKNHKTEGSFKRGDEKGMFEFGGSSVVMLFQKGAIAIDEAIYRNTQQDKETIVKMGNKIGQKPL